MLTTLHNKILSMCLKTRDGENHWILRRCRTIWVPEIQMVVTTKRAAYAMWRGEIPPEMDVRTTCEVDGCINPHHAELWPSRRTSRGLSLPDQLEALAKPTVFVPAERPNVLPRELSLRTIEMVKYLAEQGTTTEGIRHATSISTHEIMKIKSGVYDHIAEKLTRPRNKRLGYKDAKSAKSAADISDDRLEGAVVTSRGPSGPPEVAQDVVVSEEEAAWLKQIGKG